MCIFITTTNNIPFFWFHPKKMIGKTPTLFKIQTYSKKWNPYKIDYLPYEEHETPMKLRLKNKHKQTHVMNNWESEKLTCGNN